MGKVKTIQNHKVADQGLFLLDLNMSIIANMQKAMVKMLSALIKNASISFYLLFSYS